MDTGEELVAVELKDVVFWVDGLLEVERIEEID